MIKKKNVLMALGFILMLSVNNLLALSPGFSVAATGDSYTDIEFRLSDYEIISVEVDGVVYQRLYHPESGFILNEGLPELLSFSVLISVPNRGIVTADELLIHDSEVISGINIFPSQGFEFEIDEKKGFVIDEKFYEQDTEYPGKPFQISSPAIMRDYRIVTVNINPFSYNPARSELQIANHLTLRINYDTSIEGVNEITRPQRRYSRDFHRLFRGSVLNNEQFHNPATRHEFQKRSIIVVHHHTQDNSYVTNINHYLNWKRDKGFEVTAITTANYNNTNSIKAYIQNAYQNWENPPEHVVMIGNKNGTIAVPIWSILHPETYNSPGTPVDTDHPYTTLEGNDELSDVFVGRISVANATQLAAYWYKLRNYERTPYEANTAWYNRRLLVGDSGTSGVSVIFTNRYIKDLMLRHTPNNAITEVYAAPFAAQMQTAINNGVSIFNFRGLENIGGWWYPNSNDIENGLMLPNQVVLTCRTMLWSASLQIDALFNMGTPTAAKGSITGIGMSHVTRTAFNNSLAGGIYHGIYVNDMYTMGEALNRGKVNLWQAFYNSHWAAEGLRHTRMINLYGDPSMDIWLRAPQTLNVVYPAQMAPGSNSIQVTVTDANNQPVEDVWVTIRKGEGIGNEPIFVTGYTNSEGVVTYLFSPSQIGNVTLTATKPDYRPHLGSFEITGNAAVGFDQAIVNGSLTAGGQPNFVIRARNYRNQAVNGVTGTIATDSEYIEIVEAQSGFGNIAATSTADSNADYVIRIAPDTPSGHKANFTLTLSDNAQNNWLSRFDLIINNGKLTKTNLVINDGNNGVLDPTEEAIINVHLRNTGSVNLEQIYGSITGGGYGLSVISDTAYFGNIAVDQTVTSIQRHIVVSTSSYVIPGMNFNLNLNLFNEDGFSQVIPITIPIGTVTVNDPLGPDEYGYWCYDYGDTDYMEAPEYEWIEIVPQLGGNGVNTGLQADWNNNQGVVARNLPFTFKFYGVEYNVISISANGWVTFGTTALSTQRNWIVPGPLGPSPIIAAFWDNLSLAQGGVYTYYDQENSRYIIQWQNALNVINSAPETFQIHLYDPEYHFTTTGDGPVKIQYRVFNNVNNGANNPAGIGNWGNYATIGIADHTCKIGLQYTFNNRYPTAARPLGHQTALFFTTGSLGASPYVAVDNFSYVDDNNNIPEYGEVGNLNFTLINIGGEMAENVSAQISSTDQYVTILQNTAQFGDMESEQNVNINNAYTIQIADNVPTNHRIVFNISITAEGPINWNFRFNLDVKAPDLVTMTSYVFDPFPGGNDNGLVDPGEDLIVFLPIKNQGGANSPPVNLTITTDNPLVQINGISETEYNTIIAGQTMYPALSLSISEDATTGTGLVFNYTFETGEYEFSGNFLLGVGGVIPASLGTGQEVTTTATASPINIYFKTLRSQTVYTAQELYDAGVTTGGPITQFGFWVADAPQFPLLNFIIRMNHTTAVNASAHIAGPYQTVYTNNSYAPTAGGWDMLVLTEPFNWNGIDNIMVDTAFSPVASWHSSGQIRKTDVENGFRFVRADNTDQTNVETNSTSNDKPHARMLIDTSAGDASNRPEDLSGVFVGANTVRLTWRAPDNQEGLLGYNVYRNGIKSNEEPVAGVQYDDNVPDVNITLYYYVTAVYEQGETLPSNIIIPNLNFVSTPEISPEGGNYYDPIQITITTETEDALIYYTLNGLEPTENDILYEDSFELNTHANLRVKAFKDGFSPSQSASEQYYLLLKPTQLTASATTNSVTLRWVPPYPIENQMANSVSNRSRNERSSRSESGSDSDNVLYRSTGNRNSEVRRNTADSQKRSIEGFNIYRAEEAGNFHLITASPIQDSTFIDRRLEQGLYRYYVTSVYVQGESNPSTIVNAQVGDTNIDEEPIPVTKTELLNAYPNPFNPETVINFTLKDETFVTVDIFNTAGRKVNTIANSSYEAGRHSIVWYGNDKDEKRLSSGIYFYKMTAGDYQAIKKIVMLK